MIDDGEHMKYRVGTWGPDEDSESSNWKEFSNVVEALEREAAEKTLSQSIVILATDNSTVEACFYKGNSSSRKLFELVLRVRCLELHHNFKLYITHVAGKRMIAQGTDGFSRGQFGDGCGLGETILKFCPWGISALDRYPPTKSCLLSIVGPDTVCLKPEGWLVEGHDIFGGHRDSKGFWRTISKPKKFLWTPPPAAADVALEQLRITRVKRRNSAHVVAIPKLFTHLWRKQLHKTCDLVVEVPPGSEGWSESMYEPLMLGFVFPFLPHRPWILQGAPKMHQMGRNMRQLFKENKLATGSVLSQFWNQVQRFYGMQSDMVYRLLYFKTRTKVPCKQSDRKSSRKRRKVIRSGSVFSESLGRHS